jgi:hypothetical protein
MTNLNATSTSTLFVLEVSGLESYEAPAQIDLQVYATQEAAMAAAFAQIQAHANEEDGYFYAIEAKVYTLGLNGTSVPVEGVTLRIDLKRPTKLLVNGDQQFVQTTRGTTACLEFITSQWGPLRTAADFLNQLKKGA